MAKKRFDSAQFLRTHTTVVKGRPRGLVSVGPAFRLAASRRIAREFWIGRRVDDTLDPREAARQEAEAMRRCIAAGGLGATA